MKKILTCASDDTFWEVSFLAEVTFKGVGVLVNPLTSLLIMRSAIELTLPVVLLDFPALVNFPVECGLPHFSVL